MRRKPKKADQSIGGVGSNEGLQRHCEWRGAVSAAEGAAMRNEFCATHEHATTRRPIRAGAVIAIIAGLKNLRAIANEGVGQ